MLAAQIAGARTIEFETTEVTSPDVAPSPDGEHLIFTMLGHLFRLPVGGGRAEQLTFGPYYHSDPVFSPDGRRVAFVSDRDGSDGNVFVLDLGTQQIKQITHEPWAGRPDWTPDGRGVVYLSFVRELALSRYQLHHFALVRRVDLRGGAPETLSGPPRIVRSVFHLRDGRIAWTVIEDADSPRATTRIEVRSGQGAVSTLRVLEGIVDRAVASAAGDGIYCRRYPHPNRLWPEDLLHIPLPTGPERAVSRLSRLRILKPRLGVSADGQSLYLGEHGRLWRSELPAGIMVPVAFIASVRLEVPDPVVPSPYDPGVSGSSRQPRSILHPRLSPDGKNLVFGAAGFLWKQPLDGGEARRLFSGDAYESEPAWSPDGRQLAFLRREFGQQQVKVFDLSAGRTRTLALGRRYFGLSWSPDGERLVFVEAGRLPDPPPVVSVNLSDGRREDLMELAYGGLWARPHFSSDGQALFFSPPRASTSSGTLQRLPLKGDTDAQPVTHLAHIRDALVSPDGDWLAFRRNTEIWVAPLEDLPVEEVHLRRLSAFGGQTFAFTPDGSAVVYAVGNRVWRHPLISNDPEEIPIRLRLPIREPPPLLLKRVRVLDFDKSDFRAESSLFVEKGYIRSIDSEHQPSLPPGTIVLDGGGRYVIPGLFDLHVHTEVTGAYQEALLSYGVTSVRDVGAPLSLLAALADRGDSTGDPVPRYFFAGDVFEGAQPDPPPHWMMKLVTEKDARSYMLRWKQAGASFIKVHPPISWPLQRAVAEEARRLNLPVVGHGNYVDEIVKSVTLGYWTLEHLIGVSQDVHLLLAAAGTRVTPTAMIQGGTTLLQRDEPERLADPKLRAFIPEWWIRRATRRPWAFDTGGLRGRWVERLASIRAAHATGVTLQIGSDAENGQSMNFHGASLHWELEFFVQAGLAPLEVLRIATQEGAAAVGAEDHLGSLEPGKLADLVLLDANPLEDIRNTQTIWRVIKGGWLFDPEKLRPPASGNGE